MGSGGGGSASGKSDFPEYMKSFHAYALFGTPSPDGNSVWPALSVSEAFNTATAGVSPYYNFTTYADTVPYKGFAEAGKTIASYPEVFKMLESFQGVAFDTLLASYSSDVTAADLIASVSTTLDDEITNNILPKFRGSMRAAGAVMSSAFVVGEAMIWDSKVKAIAKERLHVEEIVIRNKELALKITLSYIDIKKQVALATTDVMKTYYSLKTDLDTHFAQMGEKDMKWDLEMFQYCNNTLASISGAALNQGSTKSTVGSALGGALSGAAMGAGAGFMMGGPPGALIGGIAGGALGLAGGLF